MPQRQLRNLLPERALRALRRRAHQAADLQLHHHTPAATGRSASRLRCRACTRRDAPPQRGHAASGVVVRARSRRVLPVSSTSSRTSDDKPGNRTAARSRRHQREDHRPGPVTRTRHAGSTTFSVPEPMFLQTPGRHRHARRAADRRECPARPGSPSLAHDATNLMRVDTQLRTAPDETWRPAAALHASVGSPCDNPTMFSHRRKAASAPNSVHPVRFQNSAMGSDLRIQAARSYSLYQSWPRALGWRPWRARSSGGGASAELRHAERRELRHRTIAGGPFARSPVEPASHLSEAIEQIDGYGLCVVDQVRCRRDRVDWTRAEECRCL